jgi:hypothetical protein
MEQIVRDTVYTGVLLWAAGYLASMAVYFALPDYWLWGKVVLLIYLPCTVVFSLWYFSGTPRSLGYYTGIGAVWSLIAIILDFPFIVIRFGAWQYYGPDVYLYYAAMFVIPVAAGIYRRKKETGVAGQPPG